MIRLTQYSKLISFCFGVLLVIGFFIVESNSKNLQALKIMLVVIGVLIVSVVSLRIHIKKFDNPEEAWALFRSQIKIAKKSIIIVLDDLPIEIFDDDLISLIKVKLSQNVSVEIVADKYGDKTALQKLSEIKSPFFQIFISEQRSDQCGLLVDMRSLIVGLYLTREGLGYVWFKKSTGAKADFLANLRYLKQEL